MNARKYHAMKALLTELQRVRYHEPDSDSHEYCADCKRSPYNNPQHSQDCIVPRLAAILNMSDD